MIKSKTIVEPPVNGVPNLSSRVTYLCTGTAGFIGSAFVKYMLEKYPNVQIVTLDALTYAGNPENLSPKLQGWKDGTELRSFLIKGDIGDQTLVKNIFKMYNPDYVINFAAESHVDRSIADPQIFIDTNVRGTVNLLQCCKDAWMFGREWADKKFIQISTDEVYGALGREGFFTETTPLNPHSPYAASKASADMIVKAFHDTYGMPVNITRCSNNYGPRQMPEKLIPLVINNCLHHKELPVYGDGLQIRDWLYVYDHCKAIDMVVDNGRSGEVYNIGGHNERTNLQILHEIIHYMSEKLGDPEINEGLIRHVEDRMGHDRRYGIDPTKITNELGWYPETAFEDGIIKTIDWYLNNPDWLAHATSGQYADYYKKMYENKV